MDKTSEPSDFWDRPINEAEDDYKTFLANHWNYLMRDGRLKTSTARVREILGLPSTAEDDRDVYQYNVEWGNLKTAVRENVVKPFHQRYPDYSNTKYANLSEHHRYRISRAIVNLEAFKTRIGYLRKDNPEIDSWIFTAFLYDNTIEGKRDKKRKLKRQERQGTDKETVKLPSIETWISKLQMEIEGSSGSKQSRLD